MMKMTTIAGELVTPGGKYLMTTSSGLMPLSDPLSRTSDTQTHIYERTHTLHIHTLWFPVAVLIWHAICAGWLLFEIEMNTAPHPRTQ